MLFNHGGFLHREPPDGFSCRRHNAYRLMNDDCGFLIFEVTGGRILPLPIANQQSSLINRQFFPLVAIPGSVQKSVVGANGWKVRGARTTVRARQATERDFGGSDRG